ncbi:unnamed protein product [uncultured bacterium]|nr:unnamed protein product [uncultured bacterium]
MIWTRNDNGGIASDNYPNGLVLDGSNNAIITGYHRSAPYFTNVNFYTAKYTCDWPGAIVWSKEYDDPAHSQDISYALGVFPSGNVVVTGQSYASASDPECFTLKYGASDGTVAWQNRDSRAYTAKALTVDSSGYLIVTGQSKATGGFYTAKYGGAGGGLVWATSDGGNSVTAAVAVDGSGNVFVTGTNVSYNPTQHDDYCTVKYDAATGDKIWQSAYPGVETSGTSVPAALATDSAGNVIVTGYSYVTSGSADFCTVKYAAATGTQIWVHTYNGPSSRDDKAKGIVVDTNGDVYVTGSSPNSNGDNDFYTAKYSGSNHGALVWAKRYNNGGDDQAMAIALDPTSGNVVVTGSSSNTTTGLNEYCTVKYNSDGVQMWAMRY